VSHILLLEKKTPGPRDKHTTSRPLKTVPSMQVKTTQFLITLN